MLQLFRKKEEEEEAKEPGVDVNEEIRMKLAQLDQMNVTGRDSEGVVKLKMALLDQEFRSRKQPTTSIAHKYLCFGFNLTLDRSKENRYFFNLNTTSQCLVIANHNGVSYERSFHVLLHVQPSLKYDQSFTIYYKDGSIPNTMFFDTQEERDDVVELLTEVTLMVRQGARGTMTHIEAAAQQIGCKPTLEVLVKKSGRKKAERWFVNVGSRLLVFVLQSDDLPHTVISLLDATLQLPDNSSTLVIKSQAREFKFDLPSPEEARKITKHLSSIQEAPKRERFSVNPSMSVRQVSGNLLETMEMWTADQVASWVSSLHFKYGDQFLDYSKKLFINGADGEFLLNMKQNRCTIETFIDPQDLDILLIEIENLNKAEEMRRSSSVVEEKINEVRPSVDSFRITEELEDPPVIIKRKLGKLGTVKFFPKFNLDRPRDVFTFGNCHTTAADYKQGRIIEMLSAKNIIFVRAAVDGKHAFGITNRNWIFAWGECKTGAMGLGKDTKRTTPHLVSTLREQTIIRLSTCSSHTLAVTQEGVVFGWGSGYLTGLGQSKYTPSQIKFLNVKIKGVSCCSTHSAAWNDKELFVWGRFGPWLGVGKDSAQASIPGTPVPFATPKLPETKVKIRTVVVAKTYTLVLFRNGDVYFFGNHWNTDNHYEPIRLKIPSQIVQMSAVKTHAGFISGKGELYMIGEGSSYQLGWGKDADTDSFCKISLKAKLTRIYCGQGRTAALTSRGCALMWGEDLGSTKSRRVFHTHPFAQEEMRSHRIYDVGMGSDFFIAMGQKVEEERLVEAPEQHSSYRQIIREHDDIVPGEAIVEELKYMKETLQANIRISTKNIRSPLPGASLPSESTTEEIKSLDPLPSQETQDFIEDNPALPHEDIMWKKTVSVLDDRLLSASSPLRALSGPGIPSGNPSVRSHKSYGGQHLNSSNRGGYGVSPMYRSASANLDTENSYGRYRKVYSRSFNEGQVPPAPPIQNSVKKSLSVKGLNVPPPPPAFKQFRKQGVQTEEKNTSAILAPTIPVSPVGTRSKSPSLSPGPPPPPPPINSPARISPSTEGTKSSKASSNNYSISRSGTVKKVPKHPRRTPPPFQQT